jgi:hypothetical protein
MATTNNLIEPIARVPRLSPWVKVKRWILNVIEESPIIQLLCCVDGNVLEIHRQDELVRQELRSELRKHLGYNGRDTCVSNAIDEVLQTTGYDLADGGSIRKANLGVTRTISGWDAYFKGLGVADPLLYCAGVDSDSSRNACIVPKFAAACTLHIRTKLGALAVNEANMLLVQRKYLEICRKHGVRDVDTVLHQQFVLNAVFTESALDDVATSRRRLPQWVSWLSSLDKTNRVDSTIC